MTNHLGSFHAEINFTPFCRKMRRILCSFMCRFPLFNYVHRLFWYLSKFLQNCEMTKRFIRIIGKTVETSLFVQLCTTSTKGIAGYIDVALFRHVIFSDILQTRTGTTYSSLVEGPNIPRE